MKIIANTTPYDTRDLRSIILRALRQFGVGPEDHQRLKVTIRHSKNGGYSGIAMLGRRDRFLGLMLGRRMILRIPRLSPIDPASFAALTLHEVAHLVGWVHQDFGRSLMRCEPSIARWAEGMLIRRKDRESEGPRMAAGHSRDLTSDPDMV